MRLDSSAHLILKFLWLIGCALLWQSCGFSRVQCSHPQVCGGDEVCSTQFCQLSLFFPPYTFVFITYCLYGGGQRSQSKDRRVSYSDPSTNWCLTSNEKSSVGTRLWPLQSSLYVEPLSDCYFCPNIYLKRIWLWEYCVHLTKTRLLKHVNFVWNWASQSRNLRV